MTESYPIRGIPNTIFEASDRPPKRPLRQEVDDWYSAVDVKGNKINEIQINLFFLALTKFQAMDVPDKLSYFRVAGIHGEPRRPWDEKGDGRMNESYCTHNRILFPTWHRPYLLLYEQRLYEIMIDEIKKFPASTEDELSMLAKLLEEAAAWRLPYWDWATKRAYPAGSTLDYRVPLIVREKEVEITFGHGPNEATTTEWRPNPMYQFSTPKPMGDYGDYSIPPVIDDGTVYPFDKPYATSRRPDFTTAAELVNDQAWIEGIQHNDKVDEALQGHKWYSTEDISPIAEAIHRIFSTEEYNDFATTKYNDQGSENAFISLEYVHNNIHNWVGGPGGHMSETEVAAFDPIFWMHHNNVDRIFAIWQVLHPDAWFDSTKGETDTSHTALAPFHIDENHTTYTSDLARHLSTLNYSYPELQPWLDEYYVDGEFREDKYKQEVTKKVNNLYGSEKKRVRLLFGHNSSKGFTDYVINVIYGRYALGGASYTIHFFLKDVKNAKFGKDGKRVTRVEVGSVYNFSSPITDGGCENCRNQEEAGVRSRAQVLLTTALLEELFNPLPQPTWSTWEGTDVETYLTNHLEWTVTKGSGEDVPLESIPSLQIFVARGTGIHPAEPTKLSEYKGYKVLKGVTEGRLGGIKPDFLL